MLEVKSKNSTIGSIFLWLITPEEAFIERMIKLDTPKMSTRARTKIISPNADALVAFVSKKAEVDSRLTRLQALSDNHFNYSPDEITWGHVGSLEQHADLLKRIYCDGVQRGRTRSIAPLRSPTAPRTASPVGARGHRRAMVLSDHGDRSMTKLSDTQFVILSAAAQRDGGAVLPLPATLKIKGGAVDKVLSSLKATGLIDHQGTPRGNDPPPLRITRAGLEAIGVETEEACDVPTAATQAQAVTTQADTGATSADAAAQAMDARAPVARADRAATPAKTGTAAKRKARIAEAALAGKPAPRAGTKQSLMIELLKRAEGATVEQIAAATGWQHHTIRGAISGALKKRLGFTIEVTRARELGPNKVGAKGSSQVRIVASPVS